MKKLLLITFISFLSFNCINSANLGSSFLSTEELSIENFLTVEKKDILNDTRYWILSSWYGGDYNNIGSVTFTVTWQYTGAVKPPSYHFVYTVTVRSGGLTLAYFQDSAIGTAGSGSKTYTIPVQHPKVSFGSVSIEVSGSDAML